MLRAIAFGTFDGLHDGHRHFLARAGAYGKLRVIVARDTTVKKVKGRPAIKTEVERLYALKNEGYDAVLGENNDYYAVIEAFEPHIICLGYDQHAFTERLVSEISARGLTAEIIRLGAYRPDIYKSSKLNNHPHAT